METIKGKNVKITDTFWSGKMKTVHDKVIPYQWEALNDRLPDTEPSYAIANFKTAAAITSGELDQSKAKAEFHGCVFQDSDLAKWIEASAFSLNWHPDEKLEKTIDDVIDLVCAAQQPDGYLDTYFIINGLDKRFTNIADAHEMYCLGHFLEAACAYYHATGKDKLLNALIKYVDLIDQTFGEEEGKLKGYPGHEVLEMALMKLYEITKDPKHLKLAAYFINQRGQSPNYFAEEKKKYKNKYYWEESLFQYGYYQAHKPVREQKEAVGHAVRAVYLYSGMADVARVTGDESLKKACHTLWNDVVRRQMYVTGSIGSSTYGEAFTFDYDLPNEEIYGETCAAIGLVFFAMRMLKMDTNGVYADVMEKALYNGIISGISLDGTKFFYVNPLAVKPKAVKKDQRLIHVEPRRQKWFACACCPPNLARMMTSLGEYIYTTEGNTVYQNLFIGSDMKTEVNGKEITLHVTTSYPWEETVSVRVESMEDAAFEYAFRVPGWCRGMTVKKNGMEVSYHAENGYGQLEDPVKNGDEITLVFEMPVTFVKANPKVRQDIGKTAVMKGPVVYCLEEDDNGEELQMIHLAGKKDIHEEFVPDLLGGIVRITMTAWHDGSASLLWQTLEDNVPTKYFLSPAQCSQFLRLAEIAGCPPPAEIEALLLKQGGVYRSPDPFNATVCGHRQRSGQRRRSETASDCQLTLFPLC